MKKSKPIPLLLTLLCFLLLVPLPAHAQMEVDSAELEDAMSLDDEIYLEPHPKVVPEATHILEDIKRAQEYLRDKNAGGSQVVKEKKILLRAKRGKKRTKVVSTRISKPNFLLAVEDLKERKIWPVLITNAGRVTNGFDVTKHHDNGVGSRFEVKYPQDMAILALRTTVRSGKNSFEEVVYTPYGPEIDTAEVRQAGLTYLMQQIEQAQRDLKARKVPLYGLGRLGTDNMTTNLAVVLSIIEHIDPGRFMSCEKGREIGLVNEVLTIIGANTTDAYAYSKSPAGARGLFQFVPDTYKRLAKRYPQAGLKKDFVLGCTDHVNAAKASLLLFDADLICVPESRLRAIRQDVRETGRYLAAAYNCGSQRVYKSAKKCRDEWTCQLPEETKVYLKKFDVVWELARQLGQ